MRDIHIVPFSAEILKRYENLITTIQGVLLEMINNRIICIRRQINRVFPKSYNEEGVSSEDAKQIDKQIQIYYKNRAFLFVPNQINYDIGDFAIKKELKWYFETYD